MAPALQSSGEEVANDINNNNSEELKNGKKHLTKEESKDSLNLFANLSEEELVRGETPPGIDRRCLALCQAYIGGSWANARSVDDIHFKRITGGLTNQLYKVELKESVQRVRNPVFAQEPSAVAIKMYMPKHMQNSDQDRDERLTDTIVLTILSQTGLGPQVYGIFEGGFIQAYHENEQFGLKHQQNPVIVRKAAQAIARVHALQVPIRKHKTVFFLDQMSNFVHQAYETRPMEEEFDKFGLTTLKRHPIREELKSLTRLVESLEAPFVFSHCDFRGINTLVTVPEGDIKLVDLEYSGYTVRGMDLGSFLMEWGHERFAFGSMGIPPDDSVLREFIAHYIGESDRLSPGYSSDTERNSAERIVRETKVMIMMQFLLFTSFFLKSEESFIAAIDANQEGNLRQAEGGYKKYFEVKNQLVSEGVIEWF